METAIFKDIKSKSVSETGTEEISAWLFPSERPESSTLSSIGLSRKGEESKQGPGKQVPRYFYKVYDRTDGIEETDEAQYPQFTVTYGNRNGGGAPSFLDQTGSTEPTKAIYNQYADTLLRDGEKSFGFRRDHFYAINFNSRVLRNRIANFELTLGFSNEDLTLIRDEKRIVDITTGIEYGLLYPKRGILILNPDRIAEEISAKHQIVPETRDPQTILNSENVSNTFVQPGDSLVSRKIVKDEDESFVYEGGYNGDLESAKDTFPDWPYVRNHDKIFEAIQRGESFSLNVERTTITNTYEIEIGPDEFNHSTNPTYSDDSGNIDFLGNNPYYTTAGLYDDDKRLLAVAKLDHPNEKVESDLTIEISH